MVCTRLLELAATRGVRVCSWIGFIVQDVMVVFFFRKEGCLPYAAYGAR